MIERPTVRVDGRDASQVFEEMLARRAGYVPELVGADRGAGVALARIASRYLYAVIQRLNQAPGKNKLAFLDTLGLRLVSARSARVPIVFQLSEQAASGAVPAGTPVAAPPPPGSTDQIVFETERATGLMAGRLRQIFSLWPGRDEYIDHSAAALGGVAFQPFLRRDLTPTPHVLYISHPTLLALTGRVELSVSFELTHPSGEPLATIWEYWDGLVWRAFLEAATGCTPVQRARRDSTNGLTNTGSVHLRAEGVKAQQTAVDGAQGFWIRGRLTEPLTSDPDTSLPEVETVQLSTHVIQPLTASIVASKPYFLRGRALTGFVRNEAGEPVANATVAVTLPLEPDEGTFTTVTNASGVYVLPDDPLGKMCRFEVIFGELHAEIVPREPPTDTTPSVDLTLLVDGVKPDKAFADGTALDVTKPFFPLGQQPQPGSTFYFTSAEIFGKPNAHFRIWMARARSTQDEAGGATDPSAVFEASGAGRLPHLLVWEYWNGSQWVPLAQSQAQPPSLDLDVTEMVRFTVPLDMAPVKVNDQEALWMRVRLMSGSFGFRQTVVWSSGGDPATDNSFTHVITQPPALSTFRMGYDWEFGPFHAERVLAYNDFRYKDRTYEARWPGETFAPFERVGDLTPSLYLGFDRKPTVDLIGVYFDVEENVEESRGPALAWEYWDGFSWRLVAMDDETRNLRVPGIASFVAADDSQALARFGAPALHWIRARLKEDGPPGSPVIRGVFHNAVWAAQVRTLTDVPLGASSGMPNQVLRITQIPVLPGEQIDVRELAGLRANVEWRILALEITGGDRKSIEVLESELGQEGPQTEFVYGGLRLRRDRNKKVAEVWVRWHERPHLFLSRGSDRHYVLDRVRGRLVFGDGANGKVPPPGAAILARRLRVGGGTAGNVATRKISQLLGAVAGVESVYNPRPAEGGANSETLERFATRGPRSVRHRGRALSASDYETLAREASAAVAVARTIPGRMPNGRPGAGWVTVVIIPYSRELRPWPSWGLRQEVTRFIAARASADLAAAARIYVTGPEYVAVGITATIAPASLDRAGEVERRAREALHAFLHPLSGGPSGGGWDAGRGVYLSDVAAVLESLEGVDYLEALALLRESVPQGERLAVAPQQVVVAGLVDLKIKAAEG